MLRYIQNFRKFLPLLKELVSRDIKIKYRRSVLGVLWTLLNPLGIMIILSVVFSNLFRFDVENFPLYVLSGQLVFNFFSDSTTNSMTAIIGGASLIKKVYMPKYLFVFSRVISSGINLMASFVALFLVMLATRVELCWTTVFAVLPLGMLVVFSLGVGMFLAAVTVKFRDIVHLYSVFITALLYMTPVIYPMSILPGVIRHIVMINPLTNYLLMFRAAIFSRQIPGPAGLLLGAAEAIIALAVGCWVFYKQQDSFILFL